ncbi:MAG: DUF2344 domain-containing protein, partial [Spirochaeta sp.]|nr:DUF2344 domain-containing protein [Spirochaeta sp.]
MPDVRCERVFAPAPDFEAELRAQELPLYSLETGRVLRDFDILAFSVGYELTLTNLLNILEMGGVSLQNRERSDDQPLVIAGGPAVTNPLPLSPFVDCFFMGEADGWLEGIFAGLAAIKRRGGRRSDLLDLLRCEPAIWFAGKEEVVKRHLCTRFGQYSAGRKKFAELSSFPVPNIRTVQDHGVVEIMRGCAQGCRFCHASFFYRPFRLKEPALVVQEVDELIYNCGYREITLSSLSSGDYPDIAALVEALNHRYRDLKVSFALPSLRIDSIALQLLSGLSEVRKSGLTFAVETPRHEWQRGVNKQASPDRTIAILKEAKMRGWKKAKFYFMVGLPVSEGQDETLPIVEFLKEVRAETGMSFNVNVAAFIPKPHTPYQWSAQLGEEQALDKIMFIKRSLSGRGFKVNYHSPFLSLLEGMVSRGDERAGELVLKAFKAGARLDAWEEHIKWDIWRGVLKEAAWDVEHETCRKRSLQEKLPWESIKMGAAGTFLERELEKSQEYELTPACVSECTAPCGACTPQVRIKDRINDSGKEILYRKLRSLNDGEYRHTFKEQEHRPVRKIRFSFIKAGKAVFLSHLNVMLIFERTFLRAGYLVQFTQGYNPKPRLEFAHPLSLGIESREEIAGVELLNYDSTGEFIKKMNRNLPEGLKILALKEIKPPLPGRKKHSLMSLYRGSDYFIAPAIDSHTDRRPVLEELCRSLERIAVIDGEAAVSGPAAADGLAVDGPAAADGLAVDGPAAADGLAVTIAGDYLGTSFSLRQTPGG